MRLIEGVMLVIRLSTASWPIILRGGSEHDARLLAIGRGGDHLPAGFLLGTEAVQEPERSGQGRLAGAARHHDESRAHLPAAQLVDRAVDPADDPLLPVLERERLAGEPTLMQPELADEPDSLLGPAERVGDPAARPEPGGAGPSRPRAASHSRSSAALALERSGPADHRQPQLDRQQPGVSWIAFCWAV